MERRLASRLAVAAAVAALLALFVVQAATSIRHKSLTHDEGSHFSYGRQVLEQRSFLRLVHQHNATSPWMALHAAAAATAADGEAADALRGERLRRARLATLLFGVALGLLVFAWAREAYGTAAGLLALALHAFSPNLLAHTRLVTTDVLAALGIVAAAWTLWRLHRRRSAGRLAAAGLALGFALSTKATAIDLLPVFVLLVAWHHLDGRRARRPGGAAGGDGRWWRPWADLALVGLVALVALNGLHLFEGSFATLADHSVRSQRFQELTEVPGLAAVPLPLPAGWVQGLDWLSEDLERGRWTYLLGEYSRDGFPHYYLVAFLVKSTPAFLSLLLLAGALAAARRLPRRDRPGAATPSCSAARYLLLPAAVLFLHLSLFHSFQIGIRHLLPVYPLLCIAASPLAAAAGLARSAAWALVALHAASSLAVHPHYLATFNELAGGPRAGWRYLADSNIDWGQDRALARHMWAPASLVPVIEDPGGPTAGRLLVRVNRLVGLSPAEHQTYAWLRDHFEPVDSIGHSWLVYDVDEEALAACCGTLSEPLPQAEGGLVLLGGGRGIGGAESGLVERLDRLVDGHLGSGARVDAARTAPLLSHPVEAWFGVEWDEPVVVSRLVAYPVLALRGPHAGRFQARAASFEIWREGGWLRLATYPEVDSPRLALDLAAPVVTRRIRLVVHSQRNHRGLLRPGGRFRAACLEIAAYGAQ
jgi:hypothetical protein